MSTAHNVIVFKPRLPRAIRVLRKNHQVIHVDWEAWAVTEATMRAACRPGAFLLPARDEKENRDRREVETWLASQRAKEAHLASTEPSKPSDRGMLPGMAEWLASKGR